MKMNLEFNLLFPKLVVARHLKISNRQQNLKIMLQFLLMTRESILSVAYQHHRDALLLKEAKEDREERKEFQDMLKNANDSFVHALNNMSQSILSIRMLLLDQWKHLATQYLHDLCHYLTTGLNSNQLNSNRMGIFSCSQPGHCFMKAINGQALLK
jgi:hypothetical protein